VQFPLGEIFVFSPTLCLRFPAHFFSDDFFLPDFFSRLTTLRVNCLAVTCKVTFRRLACQRFPSSFFFFAFFGRLADGDRRMIANFCTPFFGYYFLLFSLFCLGCRPESSPLSLPSVPLVRPHVTFVLVIFWTSCHPRRLFVTPSPSLFFPTVWASCMPVSPSRSRTRSSSVRSSPGACLFFRFVPPFSPPRFGWCYFFFLSLSKAPSPIAALLTASSSPFSSSPSFYFLSRKILFLMPFSSRPSRMSVGRFCRPSLYFSTPPLAWLPPPSRPTLRLLSGGPLYGSCPVLLPRGPLPRVFFFLVSFSGRVFRIFPLSSRFCSCEGVLVMHVAPYLQFSQLFGNFLPPHGVFWYLFTGTAQFLFP